MDENNKKNILNDFQLERKNNSLKFADDISRRYNIPSFTFDEIIRQKREQQSRLLNAVTQKDKSALISAAASLMASRTVSERIAELNKQNYEINNFNYNFFNEIIENEPDKKLLSNEEYEIKNNELEEKRQILERNIRLSYLFSSISSQAAEKIIENEVKYTEEFLNRNTKKAVVISIDIRRSTELMLKAKNPDDYAEFISGLSEKLKFGITNNHGIFDKFTGDGILGFFPEFFTGDDAVLYALKAAKDCHNIFDDHYSNSKKLFSTVLKKIGLGIGIDFGLVSIVKINESLTVVGQPVVYACRFSAAPAGKTYINQSVLDYLHPLLQSQEITVTEEELDLKHEGSVVAYQVNAEFENLIKRKPNWQSWEA